jgi:membrane protease YdiL (CAAX protease family)
MEPESDAEREPAGEETPGGISPAGPESAASGGSPAVPPVLPAPPPSPGLRLLLYLAACIATVAAGLVPTGVIAALWLAARHGSFSPELMQADPGVPAMSSILGIYPLLALVTLLFVRFVDRAPLERVGLVRRGWAVQAAVGATAGVLFIAIGALLYTRLGWERLLPVPAQPALLLFAAAVLYPLIGITEELVFRGYLLGTLEAWRGRRLAIAATTILFWLMHAGQGNVMQPLGAASMLATGLTLALLRYGTVALWVPIGFHAAYDWAAITLTGGPDVGLPYRYEMQPLVPAWLVGPPGYSGLADLALLLILLAVVWRYVYREHPPARVTQREAA